MNYLANNPVPTDKYDTIMIGSKTQLISINSIKIMDSCSFIPFPLAEFSKAFAIKEHKKGFFPHLFNTPENQCYHGLFPAKLYYQSNLMNIDQKREFDEWYEQQIGK